MVKYGVLIILIAILAVFTLFFWIYHMIQSKREFMLPMPKKPAQIKDGIDDLQKLMEKKLSEETVLRPVKGVRAPTRKSISSQIKSKSFRTSQSKNISDSNIQSEYMDILDENLSIVNSELEELGISKKKVVHITHPGLHHRNYVQRSLPFTENDLENELKELDRLLRQSKSNPDHFVHKITQKIRGKEKSVETKKAIELVHSISQKIEGDHPIPYNELMGIKAKQKKVRESIDSENKE